MKRFFYNKDGIYDCDFKISIDNSTPFGIGIDNGRDERESVISLTLTEIEAIKLREILREEIIKFKERERNG